GDYEALPHAILPADSVTLGDAVRAAIQADPHMAAMQSSDLEAPPFDGDNWWLATATRSGNDVSLEPIDAWPFYGIDDAGRVRFYTSLYDFSVVQVDRAITNGHYSGDDVVVTRAGAFGGNGAVVVDVVQWLVDHRPEAGLGAAAERVWSRWRRREADAVRRLADDWASRGIDSPQHLRHFIETRQRWFSSVLAEWLALSESAATAVLTAIGYEPAELDAIDLRPARHPVASATSGSSPRQRRIASLLTLRGTFDDSTTCSAPPVLLPLRDR
ncbi:MAG: hypothetical protein LH645_02895, partial [Actinomycetia bacterium]|nr:hypothetical protein [Actinomycetes bacterium]